jgi:hypothetical protein
VYERTGKKQEGLPDLVTFWGLRVWCEVGKLEWESENSIIAAPVGGLTDADTIRSDHDRALVQ